MINLVLGFGRYWRELVLALCFVFVGCFVFDAFQTKDELHMARTRIVQIQTEKQQLTAKLDYLAKVSDLQLEKMEAAEVQRMHIISQLSKTVSSIRSQQVPKDCQGAVDFAVKNKGDLSWPK